MLIYKIFLDVRRSRLLKFHSMKVEVKSPFSCTAENQMVGTSSQMCGLLDSRG